MAVIKTPPCWRQLREEFIWVYNSGRWESLVTEWRYVAEIGIWGLTSGTAITKLSVHWGMAQDFKTSKLCQWHASNKGIPPKQHHQPQTIYSNTWAFEGLHHRNHYTELSPQAWRLIFFLRLPYVRNGWFHTIPLFLLDTQHFVKIASTIGSCILTLNILFSRYRVLCRLLNSGVLLRKGLTQTLSFSTYNGMLYWRWHWDCRNWWVYEPEQIGPSDEIKSPCQLVAMSEEWDGKLMGEN